MEKWKKQHCHVIKNFLVFLNKRTSDFVLKGGTSLMMCYGLNRFSEDIDFDGRKPELPEHVSSFCKKYGYEYRIAKNTDTVQRCFIHYDGQKPLKIEASYRKKTIPEDETATVNGILVYTIEEITLQKCHAYLHRDKLRDLYDVTFICLNYYEKLSPAYRKLLQNSLQYKGLEQFDFLVSNAEKDALVDTDALAEDFLLAYEKVGLLAEEEEIDELGGAGRPPLKP